MTENPGQARSAVIVVDMVRDNVHGHEHWPITAAARAIVPAINRLLDEAHARAWPVVFACDSFLPGDFLFGGRMKPHSLRGTPGAEVIEELHRAEGDMVLPKRRFSAFFKTDLDQTLRTLGAARVLVCGISSHFCVLATALDAVSHDFAAVVVQDCCAAPTPQIHAATLESYRQNPLRPLLQVLALEEVLASGE